MLSQKRFIRFTGALSAAVLLALAASANADDKMYNINRSPDSSWSSSAVPSAAPSVPATAPAPAIATSAPPPPTQWPGQPLGNLSQQFSAPPPMPLAPVPVLAENSPLVPDEATVAAPSIPLPPPATQSAEIPVQSNLHLEAASSTFSLPPPPHYRPTTSQPPQAAPQQVSLAEAPYQMALDTRSGIDLGVQTSYYHFQMPNPGETNSGPRYGGTFTGTLGIGQGLFASVDGGYAIGWLDYRGSGNNDDRRDYSWETRGLLTKDFVFEYFSVSPFAGFAYRYQNDAGGASSTGAQMLLRENEIFYAPLGFHPRFALDEDSRLASTLEYDVVATGLQTTHLSGGDPTVHSAQTGFGFRADLMYETRWWSFGPYGNYWSLNTSDAKTYHSPASTCGSATCTFTQSSDHTIEAGVQFKLHLF